MNISHCIIKGGIKMTIEKELFLKIRETANTTCNNAYLMNDGRILTARQYRQLDFSERVNMVLVYRFATRQLIKF